MRPQMDYIIAIFPDIKHDNYRNFFINYPDFENASAMTKDETLSFFANHDYQLLEQQGLGFLPVHRFTIPFFNISFRVPRPCLWLMGDLDQFFNYRSTGYWLAVFKRK